MIIPSHIQQKFYDVDINLKYVSDAVRNTIINFCEKHEFAYTYRQKTLDSLAEKIETGRFEKWSDIEDLFACTIIIPNLNYEKIVIDFLEAKFFEIELKRRGTSLKAPDVFRFDSTRFIGKLISKNGDEYRPIYNIKFEVQIRTAFEHAWIVTTHPLTYKSENADWKRFRLAAQLKAAAEQMDMLIMGFDHASEYISENSWPDIEAKREIIDKIKAAFSEGLLKQELKPRDWTRFSDNIYNMMTATGEAHSMSSARKCKYISKGIKIFLNEIQKLEPNQVPLSISLVQLMFGILSECKLLKAPLYGYIPLVTNELLTLYPSVKNFENIFLFDS